MPVHSGRTLKRTCWGILLTFLLGGIVDCELTISVPGPSIVDAKVGSNVTLSVLYTGAADPVVEWMMGILPIVTWSIGSSQPPDIPARFDALSIESDGSLTFRDVQLKHDSAYTVRMSKSGVGTDKATFTLRVFDDIENVSVSAVPVKIVEGTDAFSLRYSTLQGEADSVKWYFNGKAIENGARYDIGDKSLTIMDPTRRETGRYTLDLTNPFSSVTVHKDIAVLYGPDAPVLAVSPQKVAFDSGDSLSLSCGADGDPAPSVSWVFGGVTLPVSPGGSLNLTNVQTNQSGVYTCVLVNAETGDRLERNFTINVYERPSSSPVCSVEANGNEDLQYRCQWTGGDPEAQLSFPALNTSSSGSGDFNLTVTATPDLSGKAVTCKASHPLLQQNCNVTARGPAGFLPMVSAAVDGDGKLVATVSCDSMSVPIAMVTWFRGGQVITSGGRYLISPNTTVLSILDPALDTSDLGVYTCDAANPLGRLENNVNLIGPKISESSLLNNQEGTVVTLSWETPRTSIITGFEVQMTGPDLTSSSAGSQPSQPRKPRTDEFRTVQKKPGDARSTDLGTLDPESNYRFRVVPVAGQRVGEPSKEHRAGPSGLSGPAIAGIAAGIPCGILLLLIIIALIVFCACKRKRRQTRYPVSRAVEKVVTTQPNLNAPHNLLTGGLKNVDGPPGYSTHEASSERSSTLPSMVPPLPVRMATTV